MSKEEARKVLNAVREGQNIPKHRIDEALFALGDMTWRNAPRPGATV